MNLGVVSSCLLARKALCALLASKKEFNVALELDSALDNSELLRKAPPHVLLIDALDPRFDFNNISQLRKLIPNLRIVLFANDVDEEFEIRAVRAGARGCISRRSQPEVLERALKGVAQGELWVGRRIAARLIGKFAPWRSLEEERSASLTQREWEILGLVANGCRNKDIAAQLSISENTVKSHLYTIFKKLRVSTRLGATLHYYQGGKQDERRLRTVAAAGSQPKRIRREPEDSAAPPSGRRAA